MLPAREPRGARLGTWSTRLLMDPGPRLPRSGEAADFYGAPLGTGQLNDRALTSLSDPLTATIVASKLGPSSQLGVHVRTGYY